MIYHNLSVAFYWWSFTLMATFINLMDFYWWVPASK